MRIRWTPAAAADLQGISDYSKNSIRATATRPCGNCTGLPRVETMAGTPLPEDSQRVPGVEDRDAQTSKMLHVPSHHRETMLKGGSGNHAIRRV